MIRYILDTDHLSLLQRGHEPLRQYLATTPPDQIAITIISAEELIRGRLAQISRAQTAQTRQRAYFWFQETLDFLSDFALIPYDAKADQRFLNFRSQKIRIGTQDLRIAAIVINYKATLITRNYRDFEQVPHLKIEDWSS